MQTDNTPTTDEMKHEFRRLAYSYHETKPPITLDGVCHYLGNGIFLHQHVREVSDNGKFRWVVVSVVSGATKGTK